MAKSLLGILVSFLLLTNVTLANDVPPTDNIDTTSITAKDTSQVNDTSKVDPPKEAAPEAPAQPEATGLNQQTLHSILFDLNPELNVSIGVEKTDDDTYLIVEMDHNPTRSGFVFRFDLAFPGLITDTVVIGNSVFGFKNKPTAQMPMIETQEQVARFILGSQVHRTHQRINLSKITRELSQDNRLITSAGEHFAPKDIKDFQLFVQKPGGQGASVLQLNTERISKNTIHQVHGTEKLTDLVELTHYEVGQEIKLKAHYKMPYRSNSTQWVIVPEKSDQQGLVYKLVKNPVAGDLYEVATIAEGLDRVLPKAKSGFVWQKVLEENGVSTFSLVKEGTRLSPNVLIKYVHHLINLINEASVAKVDLEAALPQLINDHVPVTVLEERMSLVTQEILNSGHPMHILKILLREQSLFVKAELIETAGSCGQFLAN